MKDSCNVELSEQGQKEAEKILSYFKNRMIDITSEVFGDIEIKTIPHIETDAWLNYKETLRLVTSSEYASKFNDAECLWAKGFRALILKEHKDEIIELLNQDNLKKIKQLESDLAYERQRKRDYY